MSTFRSLFAIGGLAVAGAGCAQPGIVEVHEMTPPMGAQAQDGSVTIPVQDTGVVLPVQDAAVVLPVQDASVMPLQDSAIVPLPDASAAVDGSAPQDTGPAETGPAPLPPCPTGYTCSDPGAMIKALGASGSVTDPDGKPVMYSCGKGGIQNCDQKNPKGSCPDFSNAFCARLKIEFPPLDSYTCAQLCKP